MKIMFSVPVQSSVYNLEITGDKAHPWATPAKMDRSLRNTPLKGTICFHWRKTFIIQMTILCIGI